MFNHTKDDSLCYMARLVLLQPWSRLCVLLEKRVSFEDSLLLHIVTSDPAAFAGLHCLFDLFIFSLWSTGQDRVGVKLIDTYFNNKSKMKSQCSIWQETILSGWTHMLANNLRGEQTMRLWWNYDALWQNSTASYSLLKQNIWSEVTK